MAIGDRPQGGGRRGHLTRPDYFSNISDEARAYWLGYLYADGSVSKYRLSINVKPSDFYHVEKFQAEIGSRHKAYPAKSVKAVGGTMRVDISSLQIVHDLTLHGCHANKMYTLAPPTTVPDELIRHFIRGFWDGDGSIGRYGKYNQLHMSATGTNAMMEWLAAQFPCAAYIGKSGNEARVRSTSRNAEGNLDYLYRDATVYLERKRGYWLHSDFGDKK